jgi:hypothetical protein
MNLTPSPKPKSPDIHNPTTPGITAYGYDHSSHDDLRVERSLSLDNEEHELGERPLNYVDEHEDDGNTNVCNSTRNCVVASELNRFESQTACP